MMKKRPLNAFETFFAKHNVRFAMLICVEKTIQEVQVNVQRALEISRLGSLQLCRSSDDEWFLEQKTNVIVQVQPK